MSSTISFIIRFQIWIILIKCLFTAPTVKVNDPGIEDYENFFNEIDVDDDNAEEKTRNAVQSPLQRWPGTTLFYKISSDYSEEEAKNVREALHIFNRETCVLFQEYNEDRDGPKPFVFFKYSDNMCGTRVGYNPMLQNGPHDVFLNTFCLTQKGVIQHETLHVLGLYHEQSRPDRNKYVQIEYSNIPQKYWPQFMSYPEIYTTTYNVPYDYESLMHYSEFAFAKDPNKPSMRAKTDSQIFNKKMGQLNGPSKGDLTKIKIMYKCN